MKLWKSKKSLANTTTSCVSVVSGKLNLGNKSCNSHSSNKRNQDNYDDDKIETISAASTATVTNQPATDVTQGGWQIFPQNYYCTDVVYQFAWRLVATFIFNFVDPKYIVFVSFKCVNSSISCSLSNLRKKISKMYKETYDSNIL